VVEIRHATAAAGAPTVVVEVRRRPPEELSRLLVAAAGTGDVDLVVDLGDRVDAPSDLLLVLHRTARYVRRLGGSFAVVARQPSVRRLFELTLLNRTFAVFATRDEALGAGS
jgi:anti-anti-sigma regulatory factor